MSSRLKSLVIYLFSSVTGLLALLYPFIQPLCSSNKTIGLHLREQNPMLLTLLVGLSLLLLLWEMQRQVSDAKLIALLGVLVAINSTLRFIEVAIPGPGGFSPIFFLIILMGYAYGSSLGFIIGAMTLLTSALVTGGVGPWLPGQMITAGWVGMTAPACKPVVRLFGIETKPGETWLLALFGAAWGLLFGVVMNLWSWPFLAGPSGQTWQPGSSFQNTVARYAVYYMATSFVWDLGRLGGNAIMLILFGAPALRILRRFKQRFTFRYLPDTFGSSLAGKPIISDSSTDRLPR